MNNLHKKNAAHMFAAAFAENLGALLNDVIGFPWPLEVIENPNPPGNRETTIDFRLTMDGALRGECFVEFYEPQVSNLIAKIRKQPAAPFTTGHGEELASIISSAMSGLAASLSAYYGEITFKVDRVAGLAFGGMFVVPLEASADPSGAPVFLYFDCQLLESLSVSTDGRQAGDTDEAAIHPSNLNLVMDVELNVSLRFGQRQMQLRDVLELASGSVIELDRMVDDPVDLFLDGKLIARGEAVIVDGNYGLRVTEIPQPVASRIFN